MKKTYKAHPIMIFRYIKPALFVLLIPVIRGLIRYLDNRKSTQIWGLESIAFAGILLYAILRWRAFRLICHADKVEICQGVLVKTRAVIPIKGLSSIQSEQNPLDFLLKCVTFRINTEAGEKNGTDFSFKLSRKDSLEVSELLYGKGETNPVRFSTIKIAILAAATSSAFSGMFVVVPIINYAAKFAGMGINEMFEELTHFTAKMQTYFPPIVNTITLVLLAAYAASFVYSFLKFINFRLYLDSDRFGIQSGFFSKFRTSFKKVSVNDVKMEQTPLMFLLRRYALSVNVGGYGERRSDTQILVPFGTREQVYDQFGDYFPFLRTVGVTNMSKKGAVHANRFYFWGEIFFVLLVAAVLIEWHYFAEFWQLIVFAACISLLVILYYTLLCRHEYKHGKICLDKTVFVSGKSGLRRCRLFCPRENVGEIKLMRFPADKLYGTCNVRVTVCSERADSMALRHVIYEDVLRDIYRCYKKDE